jgi:hypothetical protein
MPNLINKTIVKVLFDNFFFEVENPYDILYIIHFVGFIFKIVNYLVLNFQPRFSECSPHPRNLF